MSKLLTNVSIKDTIAFDNNGTSVEESVEISSDDLERRGHAARLQIKNLYELNHKFSKNFEHLTLAIDYGKNNGLLQDDEFSRLESVNREANKAKHEGLGPKQTQHVKKYEGVTMIGDHISSLQYSLSNCLRRPLTKNEPRFRFAHRPNNRGLFRARVCLDNIRTKSNTSLEHTQTIELYGDEYLKRQDAKHSAALQGVLFLGSLECKDIDTFIHTRATKKPSVLMEDSHVKNTIQKLSVESTKTCVDNGSKETKLRPYQKRVIEEAGFTNVIIMMPTGSGKTFVAAELIKRKLELDKELTPNNDYVAVFLVPTRELVSQQAEAVNKWINGIFKIAQYKGGDADPGLDSKIIVSTPDPFLKLQLTVPKLSWNNLSIIIFDEAHHVLKKHPYRKIAMKLRRDKCRTRQVVGFSASLTYEVEEENINNNLNRLCTDLSAVNMISPTNEELEAGGYHPQKNEIKLEPFHYMPEGVIPLSARKVHLVYDSFRERIQNGNATPFACDILNVVLGFEGEARRCTSNNFVSPLSKSKLKSWEDYAHKKRKECCLPLASKVIFERLEVWYVALRMIIQTWEEEQGLVLQWLNINDGFRIEEEYGSKQICEAIERVQGRTANNFSFKKLEILKQYLSKGYDQYSSKFCCMIFVQERITAYIMQNYLDTCEILKTKGIKSGFVASRSSAITPSLKVSPSEVSNQMDLFRSGNINALIATSVIEEGIDVPSANVIIFYDAVDNSVQFTQRLGRARQKESSLFIMDERIDRPVSKLKEIEEIQKRNILTFDTSKITQIEKDITKGPSIMETNTASSDHNQKDVYSNSETTNMKRVSDTHAISCNRKGHGRNVSRKNKKTNQMSSVACPNVDSSKLLAGVDSTTPNRNIPIDSELLKVLKDHKVLTVREIYLLSIGKNPKLEQMGTGISKPLKKKLYNMQNQGLIKTRGDGKWSYCDK